MSNIFEKHIDKLRDCIKSCLINGAKDRFQFNRMRYGIICDLKRVGYIEEEIIDILKDWNQKSYRVLSYKDFVSLVADYVHWVFKKDAKVSCKSLKENDCCLNECEFMQKQRKEDNARLSQEVVYTKDDIAKHLEQYEKCKNANACAIIYKSIDLKRVKLGFLRDKTVLISFEEMKNALWENGYTSAKKMDALRYVSKLIDSGLLKRVVKGKPGCFKRCSHGYRVRTPEDVMNDDLFSYREDTENNPENDSNEDAHAPII